MFNIFIPYPILMSFKRSPLTIGAGDHVGIATPNLDTLHNTRKVIERRFHEKMNQEGSEAFSHPFLIKEYHIQGPCIDFSTYFDSDSFRWNYLIFYKAIGFTEKISL